jgi:hypothetical protein
LEDLERGEEGGSEACRARQGSTVDGRPRGRDQGRGLSKGEAAAFGPRLRPAPTLPAPPRPRCTLPSSKARLADDGQRERRPVAGPLPCGAHLCRLTLGSDWKGAERGRGQVDERCQGVRTSLLPPVWWSCFYRPRCLRLKLIVIFFLKFMHIYLFESANLTQTRVRTYTQPH